jgi:hypothetical protein
MAWGRGMSIQWKRVIAVIRSACVRLLKVVTDITLACFHKPIPFMQLAAIFMLFASFVAALKAWSPHHDRVAAEVPLLLFGVLAILLIISRTTQGFAISVAVLLIGTVVAGDRFMLAATALLKGNTPETMTFVTHLYAQESSLLRPEDIKTVASQVQAAINASGDNPAGARKAVEQVLESAQLRELAGRVTEAGATTPFQKVAAGGTAWVDFVREYQSRDYFQRHMTILRDIGVINFSADDYRSATLSAVGTQVVSVLRESPDSFSPISKPRLPQGPELSDPNDPAIANLRIGMSESAQFLKSDRNWFRFVVTESAKYRIETSASPTGGSFLDTFIVLRDATLKQKIGEDDDSGEDFFSKLERPLMPGTYFLEVRERDATQGSYTVLVSRVRK